MEKLRLFITGGTGYIGSNIIKTYHSNGWHVTTYIRNASNAASLKDLENLTVIEGSLEDKERLYTSALEHDVIIHAASSSSTVAIDAINTLVEAGQKNSQTKKTKFIYCSGCLIYGNEDKAKDETTKCDNPLEFCKWKVQFESDLVDLNDKIENFSVAIIRPNWVYGLNRSNYTNDYLKYCKDNGKVPVSKNMKDDNYMPFIHVLDNANCFYLVGTKDVKGIFNSSDNVPVTVKSFTEALAKHLNVSIVEEQHDGLFAKICAQINQNLSTIRAEEIGWTLKYPSIIESLPKVFEELYQ